MDPISQPDLAIWRINRLEGYTYLAANNIVDFSLQEEISRHTAFPTLLVREALYDVLDTGR